MDAGKQVRSGLRSISLLFALFSTCLHAQDKGLAPEKRLLERTWNPATASQYQREIALDMNADLLAISKSLDALAKTEASNSNANTAAIGKLTSAINELEARAKNERVSISAEMRKRIDDVAARIKFIETSRQRCSEGLPCAQEAPSDNSGRRLPAESEPRGAASSNVALLAAVLSKFDGPASAQKRKTSPTTEQLDAEQNLPDLFPDANFSYFAVAVPDPRVPRHQRAYEYTIEAVIAGMADEHFTLDRYWFPWVDYGAKEATGLQVPASCQMSDGTAATEMRSSSNPTNNPSESLLKCFGIMLFRADGWRDQLAPAVSVRVAYLLPETATYGISPAALGGALAHLESKYQKAGAPPNGLWHPLCPNSDDPHGRLLIGGPAFSGSATSFATALRGLRKQMQAVCLLSYSATVGSNANVSGLYASVTNLSYASLTPTDDQKRNLVFQIADHFGLSPAEVFFFVEQSTFGDSVCPPSKDRRCTTSNVVLFDANIAELRQRHAENKKLQNGKDDGIVALMTPSSSKVLRLDDTEENGNEYPISKQSPITVAGADLALSRQLSNLRHYGEVPRMVVVAATDVRDRLYLISKVKEELPWVIAVDLESDILLSHPDFIPSTRGAIMLGSELIQSGRNRASQTDHEVVLRSLIKGLDVAPEMIAPREHEVYASLVGRNGPRQIAYLSSEDEWAGGAGHSASKLFWMLRENLGVLLMVIAMAMIAPWVKIGRIFPAYIRRPLAKFGAATGAFIIGAFIAQLFATVTLCGVVIYLVYTRGKNELLDRLFVTVLVVVVIWTMVRLFALWRSQDAAERTLLAMARKIRFQLMTSLPGSVLAFGITAGVIATLLLSVKISQDVGRLLQHPDGYFLLDFSVTDGLATSVSYIGSTVVLMLAISIVASIALLRDRTRPVWHVIASAIGRTPAEVRRDREVHGLTTYILLAFLFPFLYFLFPATPLGASGLGTGYDLGFYIALVATAVTALGALTLMIGYVERLVQRCDLLLRYAAGQVKPASATIAFLGPWHALGVVTIEFAYTPIFATTDIRFPNREHSKRARRALRSTLSPGINDCLRARKALHNVLVWDVARLRNLIALAFLSCFAGVLLVYSFPVPRRDALLFTDLTLMVMSAIASAYATLRVERHALISRLLSDGGEGITWSASLVHALTLPFVLIALSILIAEVPGVREWSGSYLGPLLKLFGAG